MTNLSLDCICPTYGATNAPELLSARFAVLKDSRYKRIPTKRLNSSIYGTSPLGESASTGDW